MSRVYNFSAGPAVLPEEVLQEAAAEMMDYKGSGMSVMEMSHRSKWFDDIIKDAEKDLRELMNIPDNYKVLFLQGGASQFFAEVPMNLMKNKKQDTLSQVSGLKRLMQRLPVTVRLMLLLHRLTRPSHTFQSLILQHSQRTLTISTSV